MTQKVLFFLKRLGMTKVRVAILTGIRQEWHDVDDQTKARRIGYEVMAENLTTHHITTALGFVPEICKFDEGFELEKLAENCDVIVCWDGASGNMLLRCMRWMMQEDKLSLLAVPWFRNCDVKDVLPIGEGGFRNETDFSRHIKAAAVWSYLRGQI